MPRPHATSRPIFRRVDVGLLVVDDLVSAHGRKGTVVGNITTGEYSAMLRAGMWHTLNAGVLVQWEDGSISHHREPAFSLQRQP